MRESRKALELGQGDPAEIEGAFRALRQPDDDQTQPVLAGLAVLLHEAAPLQGGEEPRRGRLVQPESPRELGDASLTLAIAEGQQE